MGSNGSGEKPPSSGGLDDTVPASEPPLDVDGNPMRMSRASIPPVPTQRYRMGVELGRGGMGRVVEAYDTQLGRTVALKEVLPKGVSVARRFVREIEITARLEHASIVPIYDSGTTTDGRPFYVMRRVSGRPLDELIHGTRGLDERLTLLPNLLAACDAVAHAHSRGVIHRDIKPSNILVGKLGETVVIDWGLAKVIGESEDGDNDGDSLAPNPADSLQTQIGSVFGTPGFMPPEQARGEAPDMRGDVYALGATLYHLLAGRPPHAGGSATAVLGSTLKHTVKPLAQVAPGAPFELTAIAEKAMGFEAATRYATAGELAEDLRRFMAGQLVAAHRYTSAERLKRFARRHRTVLVVAALATVAVAALAWFSVHRIVQERDAANAARQQALDEQLAAERARDSLADRNDALLITQARSLLETNPTEALAVLKHLPAGSSRMPEARGVAQAAVARGVWSAIQGPDALTTRAELSNDGRYLLQVTRDSMLRVWDLDLRRLVVMRALDHTETAVWVGGRVLMFHNDRALPAQLLDPAANTAVPVGDVPILDAVASDAGERVLVRDSGGAAFIDTATLVRTPLGPADDRTSLAIAGDGTWGVVSDARTTVAFDASGRELLRIDGHALRIVASPARKLAALLTIDRVVECTLATRACRDVAVPTLPRPRFGELTYVGEELHAMLATGELVAGSNGELTTRHRIDQFTFALTRVNGNGLIIPSYLGKLLVHAGDMDATLAIPTALPHLRIASRASSSRIVAIGDGQILVTELGTVLPRRIPNTRNTDAVFVQDSTLLAWKEPPTMWTWIDVVTGARSSLENRGHLLPVIRDLEGGRALLREEYSDDKRLYVFEQHTPPRLLGSGPRAWGRLIPGGAVIFGLGERRPDGSDKPDGRVLAVIGDAPPREIVKLDGEVISAAPLGPLRYVVLSDRGEAVIGNLASGAIERRTFSAAGDAFVLGDQRGRPVVAVRDRLYLLEADLVEIARFDRQIVRVHQGGADELVVILDDNSAHAVPARPGAQVDRLVGGNQVQPGVSVDGQTLVAAAGGNQLLVVEIATRTRWTLPLVMNAFPHGFVVSPSSRQVVHQAFDGLVMWTLPTVSGDFHGWLDEQTNAVKRGDELLAWPWQVR